MRFIIYGIGAIGGTLAARLVQSGQAVAGIARGRQLAAIQADGLLLRAPDGEYRARFPVAEDPAGLQIGADDIIILAMKGQDTAGALERLRAAGITRQPIVCAQNGVANERAALRLFPNVYGMTVLMPADYVRAGEVVAFGAPKSGIFDIGRYPRGSDATTGLIVEALERAGLAAFAHADVMRSKYGKLVSNIGNVLDAAGGRGAQLGGLIERARAEAEAVLRAAGIGHDVAGSVEDGRRDLARVAPVPGVTRVGSSTAQSLARGAGSIETDYLNGEIVLLGRLHGVPVPVNAALGALGHRLVTDGIEPGSMSLSEIEAFVAGYIAAAVGTGWSPGTDSQAQLR